MTIKTLFNIDDTVTFYPETHYCNTEPITGIIVDIFIYVHDYAPNEARIMYIAQSGDVGYHVYERQIVKGFKRRKKECVQHR